MPHGFAPNLVIAGQDECPQSMTMEEYKELAALPLGYHLQWSNILLQLAMPEVDFKKPETWLVILQCLYQAGPRGETHVRQAHLDCKDEHFARRVIAKLYESLGRALGLHVNIATRVLTLKQAIRDSCMAFLVLAREVAMDWLRTLRGRADTVRDASERANFIAKKTAIALVCGCTFDVDEAKLRVILECSTAASTLVLCSLAEQQGWSEQMSDDILLKLLRLRFNRVLHRARRFLPRNQAGLNAALHRIWSGYLPGTEGWRMTP
ncbi:hypothetical protein LTR48_004006 [Friedmanniomyces endolithicus]|uniref:Uncharacterized protein n=1 Tax=Rachicladosporium monterosium TaxID=1507873 RepID=A0ABR0LFB5_9PEZI|nr:hypothetical protein LTR29_016686 [Friedmanniomyces endolithicus]KAK1092610.1 hypothetical protein LTR48_004006 [Friedmanniomyces endolithicus]KAK5147947.1 hypothetical protein LTR32_000697 [Rachicladosporium monterosium]